MGTRLLCWAALCLLGAEHTDAGVSQSPRHRVTGRGQNVTLTCDPESGHARLYWYRQSQGQGLQLMMYFQRKDPVDESGMPGAHFSAERPGGSSSTLKIQPAQPGDSAVYLCAGSLDTAWRRHLPPAHKPHALSPGSSERPKQRVYF
uniref:Ig-like domain-containing protein n=1 Tax=Oryctolagus cuniculus TaxID=9986 RepID=G1U2Y2_RABIT